jgi:hypothetical protein
MAFLPTWALDFRTVAAIHRSETLHSYHREVLAFFVPPRAMLPLLQSEYLASHRPSQPLATDITDVEETAAVLRQDADEAAVVRIILSWASPSRRKAPRVL